MLAPKDHYIRALEYAESRSSFTLEALGTAIGLTQDQKAQLALQIHQKQIFNQNANDYINDFDKQSIELHFSVEDRLLDYTSLQDARSSSKSATLFAASALVVSIISIIISACLSHMQLNSPIKIPTEFTGKIDLLSKVQIETNKTLNDLSRTLSTERALKEQRSPPVK